MADIHSSYGGGSLNVDTKAPGVSFNQSNSGLSGMLNNSMAWKQAMAEREMRMREQEGSDRAAQAKLQRASMNQSLQAPRDSPQHNRSNDMLAARQSAPTRMTTNDRGPTPRDFGHFMANNIGAWGTYVNPADVPAEMQDKIKGGFYAEGNQPFITPIFPGMTRLGAGASAGSGGQQTVQAGGRPPQEDPSPNGTGRDFANAQMLSALRRSNSEFDQRNPGLGK